MQILKIKILKYAFARMIISETSKYIVNVNNIRHFFRGFAIISYFCMDERDNEYRLCRAEGFFLPPAAACTLHGAGLLYRWRTNAMRPR